MAIANLVRLAGLTDSETWMERAETSLKSFSTVMADQPQMCPSLFSALDWFFKGITMKLSSGCVSEVLVDHYWPTVVAAIADQEIPANAVGLVCHQQACQAPSETVENLRATALELLV